jgi:hypothetical protein
MHQHIELRQTLHNNQEPTFVITACEPAPKREAAALWLDRMTPLPRCGMSRHCLALLLAAVGSLALVCAVNAECITPGKWQENPAFDAVFTGTVTLIERTSDLSYRATVTVDRVWKGKMQPQVVVDVNEIAPETPRLQKNLRYLLGAKRRDFTDPALPMGAAAFWLPNCSHMPHADAVKHGVVRQGAGYPPGR